MNDKTGYVPSSPISDMDNCNDKTHKTSNCTDTTSNTTANTKKQNKKSKNQTATDCK